MASAFRPSVLVLLALFAAACGDSATAPAGPPPVRGTVVARVFSPTVHGDAASGDSAVTSIIVRAASTSAADQLFSCSGEASFQITPRTEVRGLVVGISVADALEEGAVVDVWTDSNYPVLLMCTPSTVAARVDLVGAG